MNSSLPRPVSAGVFRDKGGVFRVSRHFFCLEDTAVNEKQELERIGQFLALVAPSTVRCLIAFLESNSLRVREEGSGLDLALRIETPDGEVQFFLHNLFLEIATVDRDQNPLRFDERLLEPGFFAGKTARVVESKLRLLSCLLRRKSFDEAVQDIEALAKDYERVRIWRIDSAACTGSKKAPPATK